MIIAAPLFDTAYEEVLPMRGGFPILFLAVSLALGCSHGGDADVAITAPPARPATDTEKQLARATHDFGFDLLRGAVGAADPGENVCVSPLSVSFALGMALNGAAGETFDAIRATLGFGDLSESEINEGYRDLVPLLAELDPAVTFGNANSAWARDDLDLAAPFVATLEETFAAEVRHADFSPATVTAINDWVEDRTEGRIGEILDAIPADAVLYLVNALHFTAGWTTRFDPEQTSDGPFTLASGATVTCPFMQLTAELPVLWTDTFEMVDLPYGSGAYSFTAIVPRPGHDLAEVLTDLSASTWAAWRAELSTFETALSMPRFTLEDDAELGELLAALGMEIAFSDRADFSRIAADRDLAISRVLHATSVVVDETGTRAAAATAVEMRETAIAPLALDRPFLFVIGEQHAGSLLFVGVVMNPIT